MKNAWIYLIIIVLALSSGLAVFLRYFSSKKLAIANNELCSSLNQLIRAADSDFKSLKGGHLSSDSTGLRFSCKVHIPGSINNVLYYDSEEVPLFITTLYQGVDSIESYRQYLKCSQQFMECRPDFKLADKSNFEKFPPGTIYEVFTFKDKIIYIKSDKKRSDNVFSSNLIITTDPESPDYDKIHH